MNLSLEERINVLLEQLYCTFDYCDAICFVLKHTSAFFYITAVTFLGGRSKRDFKLIIQKNTCKVMKLYIFKHCFLLGRLSRVNAGNIFCLLITDFGTFLSSTAVPRICKKT